MSETSRTPSFLRVWHDTEGHCVVEAVYIDTNESEIVFICEDDIEAIQYAANIHTTIRPRDTIELGDHVNITNSRINDNIRANDYVVVSNCVIYGAETYGTYGICIDGGHDINWNAVNSPTKVENKINDDVYQKALVLLKETVGEENYKLLEDGKALEVDTEKWTFGVYLDGRIWKRAKSVLFDGVEKSGGRLKSDSLPMPDLVASFYVWAKSNPDDLVSKWLCGTITIEDKTK